jgi:hypothetical protein
MPIRYDCDVGSSKEGSVEGLSELRITSVPDLLKAVELGIIEKAEARRILGFAPKRGRLAAIQPRQGGRFARGLYPFESFTEHARMAFGLAEEEAHRSGCKYLDSEDLLVGVVRQPNCGGSLVLRNLDVDEAAVRAGLAQLDRPDAGPGRGQSTSRVKNAIEVAFGEAAGTGSSSVGTQHLLLGLVVQEGSVRRLLEQLGATEDRVRHEVRQLTEPDAE